MTSFQYRSYKPELLDQPGIPFTAIRQNMKELDRINHLLGGHRISLKGLKELIRHLPNDEEIQVVEIGCGGGDNLRVINEWAKKAKKNIVLAGIDINPECIAYARSVSKHDDISFITSDYRDVIFQQKPAIIFSSLFCHHFKEDQLVAMLQWMQRNATSGFFINDLHRHPLAFYSIKFLTRIFSESYLVRNDAPLSVQRGFVKNDWNKLFITAGLQPHSIQWHWAFRWLVIYKA